MSCQNVCNTRSVLVANQMGEFMSVKMVVKTKAWFFYQLLIVAAACSLAINAHAATPPEWFTTYEWYFLPGGLALLIFCGSVIGLAGGVPKEFEGIDLWPWYVRLICGMCIGVCVAAYVISGSGLTPFVLLPSFFGATAGQFAVVVGQKGLIAFLSRVWSAFK